MVPSEKRLGSEGMRPGDWESGSTGDPGPGDGEDPQVRVQPSGKRSWKGLLWKVPQEKLEGPLSKEWCGIVRSRASSSRPCFEAVQPGANNLTPLSGQSCGDDGKH